MRGVKRKKGLLYFTRHDFDGRDRSIRTGRTRAVPLEGVSDKQLYYLPVSPPVRRELRDAPRHANQPGNHFTFIREKRRSEQTENISSTEERIR